MLNPASNCLILLGLLSERDSNGRGKKVFIGEAMRAKSIFFFKVFRIQLWPCKSYLTTCREKKVTGTESQLRNLAEKSFVIKNPNASSAFFLVLHLGKVG